MNKALKTILIVEDEAPIRTMIRFALHREFHLIDAKDVAEANLAIANGVPDLILLDWMLPDKSGIAFMKGLKQDALTREIPIIMLTAKAEESNKIKGLGAGADDYITKPFSPRELITRIKTVLRRGPLTTPDDWIHAGNLSMNTKTHVATIADRPVSLTTLEYKLLCFLVRHKNRVYSREHLLNHIWDNAIDIEARTVDVHIRRLRKKLAKFHYDKHIQTIRGVGYKFSSDIG